MAYGHGLWKQEHRTVDHLEKEWSALRLHQLLFVAVTLDRDASDIAPWHLYSCVLDLISSITLLSARLRNPVGWSPRTRRPTARTTSHIEQATVIKSAGY
ncbi:hypothetical protein V492_04531 [Pseudogymnoascus sp. VKM F-4246]|nr:hypothetical protein V492_04531 [Pseudogymnoascus sp. VKM F-4246]